MGGIQKINVRIGSIGILALAFMLILGLSNQAMGAALTPGTGNTDVTGADTIAGTEAGATDANLTFRNDAAGATVLSVVTSGAGTTNLGTISITTPDNVGDTATLTIGDGTAANVVIVNGAVTGAGLTGTAATDLNIIVTGLAVGTGASSLSLFGNVDSATGLVMNGDADGATTLTLGNGTTGITYAGTIDMSNSGTATISTLNVAASSVISGTLDVGTAAATANVINLATGSSITGVVQDTAATTLVTVNVDGNATIGDTTSNNAFILDTSATAAVAVDTATTLTLAGTGAFTVDTITLTGTTGTLNVTSAKTITGTILGASAGDGVLNIANTSGTVNIVSVVGGTRLGSITLGSGSAVDFAANVTVGTMTGTGSVNISVNSSIVALTDIGASGTSLGGISIDTGVTGTLNSAGDGTVYSNITLDGAGSTVVLGGTGETNVTGNIIAGTANQGVLTVTGNNAATVITGNVGSSTASLLTMTGGAQGVQVTGNTFADTITGGGGAMNFDGNVTAATALTLNAGASAFAGDVTASTSFDFAAASTATFDGSSSQTITGAITNGTANRASLTNANTGGTVTFANAIGLTGTKAGTITGNTGSDTVFNAAVHAQAITLTTTAKLTLDATGNTLTGALTTGAGSTITLGSASVGGTTALTSMGSDSTLNATLNTVTVNLNSAFTTGTLTLLDDTNALSATDLASFSITDTALVSYTKALNSGDIEITATKSSTSEVAATLGITSSAADALDNGVTALTGDTVNSALLSTVLNAGGSAATEAAEQLQGSPATLSAAGSAAVSATGSQVIAVGSSRLASLRSGAQFASTQASGFAGGADANKFGVWMKPFVNFGDQDMRKGIAGYETDTYGIAMGGDVKVGDSRQTTLGMSISYANTDIDSKGAGRAKTGIDSYQATLYADYTTNKWYVEGLVGFARNEIDTTRNITFSSQTASADYGSNQFMFNIGGGIPMEVAKNHFITPNASFQYTMVENETYTETGAGSLNLRVDQDEVHIAMGIFGARYHTHTEMKSGTLTPEIRTALTYDFAGDDGQSTSTYNGGGAAFGVTGADVVELGYTAGLGLSYAPLDNQGLTLSANYDWNQKTDFVGHSANFALRYEF
jgi:outer membrane autotransporter protein